MLLASASFTSPILAKSNVLAYAAGAIGKAPAPHAEKVRRLVAGGTTFQVPVSWDAMSGAQLPKATKAGGRSIGAVVSGVCPGGRAGSGCSDDVSVTFIAYGGRSGRIPAPGALEAKLDRDLAASLDSFTKGDAQVRAAAGGAKYLRYSFTYTERGTTHSEVLAAYRRRDGRGVVAIAEGPSAGMARYQDAVERFLASGTNPGDGSYKARSAYRSSDAPSAPVAAMPASFSATN